MEENKEKELDVFVKKVVDEIGLEEPSIDFTKSVLSKIRTETHKSAISFKPLISRSIWWVLTTIVFGIFMYVIFGNTSTEINWPAFAILNKLAAFNLSVNIPYQSVSDVYVYGFLGLAFFMGIQVFVLKHHFDKRYSMN